MTARQFVDHHCHLIHFGAAPPRPYDPADPEGIANWHREVAAKGSTPMDEPPEAPAHDLEGSIAESLESAALLGLVEITEAGLRDLRQFDALRRLRERGPLPLRVRLLIASGVAEDAMPARLGDEWLDVIGVKFYADGWVGPRTCALSHPFDDRPGDAGVLFLTADDLAMRATPFAEAGWTIATHAIGDRAIETVLDAYERIFGSDCREPAPRIEHAQVLRPDLIARMAEMGVVACIQPSFAVSDAATAQRALGDRMATAYRWSALLDAGVRVITGSDFPIETLDPQVGLRDLTTSLPADVALALMTVTPGQ